MIQLIAKDGDLYTPNSAISDPLIRDWYKDDDPILLCRYPAGDCDTINWPFIKDDERNLHSALFDDRETGVIPEDTMAVLLPDGKEFKIDQ